MYVNANCSGRWAGMTHQEQWSLLQKQAQLPADTTGAILRWVDSHTLLLIYHIHPRRLLWASVRRISPHRLPTPNRYQFNLKGTQVGSSPQQASPTKPTEFQKLYWVPLQSYCIQRGGQLQLWLASKKSTPPPQHKSKAIQVHPTPNGNQWPNRRIRSRRT